MADSFDIRDLLENGKTSSKGDMTNRHTIIHVDGDVRAIKEYFYSSLQVRGRIHNLEKIKALVLASIPSDYDTIIWRRYPQFNYSRLRLPTEIDVNYVKDNPFPSGFKIREGVPSASEADLFEFSFRAVFLKDGVPLEVNNSIKDGEDAYTFEDDAEFFKEESRIFHDNMDYYYRYIKYPEQFNAEKIRII